MFVCRTQGGAALALGWIPLRFQRASRRYKTCPSLTFTMNPIPNRFLASPTKPMGLAINA